MSTVTLQGNLKVPNDGHIGSVGDEDAITINSSGNVGIGTDTPNGKLHIFEETGTAVSATEGTLILEHNNPGGESSILFKSKENVGSDYGFIKYNDNGATNGGTDENSLLEIGVQNDGTEGGGNNDELKFSVPGGFMYMRADGNVGIGTDQPNIQLALGDTDTGFQQQGDGELAVYTDNVERMRIDSNGNVGIGTTNPQGKLDIRGNTYIRHGVNGSDFLSCYTANQSNDIGRFILRWNGSNSDYNAQVIMYRNNAQGVAGFFENNDDNGSFTFTGQHRSLMNKNDFTVKSIGLIVSSDGKYINMDNSLNPSINETLPYCVLSDIDNDKRVYGVISNKEDSNDLRSAGSGFVKTIPKTNTNEERIFINSLGEGAIWVSDKNGPLENGNYITSTTIKGYGGKQTLEENRLMNYTVAKITCDCDFSLTKIPKQKLKTRTVTETLQRKVEEDVTESKEKTEINFDETLNRYVQTTVTEEVTTKQIVKDTYDLYDSEGNIIGTHEVEREESYDVTKIEIDYDENGDVQYEDDLDENGAQQMVYKYETRFLQADGTQLVDEADYNTRLANGESVYIACFVGCTYHCG